MMEKYVILKGTGTSRMRATRDAMMRKNGIDVAMESAELRSEDIPDVDADPNVLSCAPVMPMALHAPLTSESASPPDGIAWGVRAVNANQSELTGLGVSVAVLDTGIRRDHPAFKGMDVREMDFTGEGNGDLNGHGTHCAGTLFGQNVDGIRIGVAPGVSTCFIGKVLTQNGQGSSELVLKGLFWAIEQRAHVIAISLGMDFPCYEQQLTGAGLPPDIARSRVLDGFRRVLHQFDTATAHARARAPNSVIVAAAGNESRRHVNSQFKASVAPPAVVEGIVSVGAIDREYAIASFSNTGATLVGPGVDICSANSTGGLISKSGTSMAVPHVAGVTALWAEKIRRSGNRSQLGSLLVGRASVDGFAKGFDPADLGNGMAKAPSN